MLRRITSGKLGVIKKGKQRSKSSNLSKFARPTFLGRGVSYALEFEGGDKRRIRAAGLPWMSDVGEICAEIPRVRRLPQRIPVKAMLWVIHHRRVITVDHYYRFTLPKKDSSGRRTIHAPKAFLREIQKWIKNEILAKLEVGVHATAYRKTSSAVDNAKQHVGKGVVLRLDLSNFFPSIEFPRVQRLFQGLGYNPGTATVLALLCTEATRVATKQQGKTRYVAVGQRHLPQGAPTSPAISNLVARQLDERVVDYLDSVEGDWVYTRYSDDLYFSHPRKDAPVDEVKNAVTKIIESEDFRINTSKTKVMRAPNQQIVTGYLVNDTVRLPRTKRREIRALLHRCNEIEMAKNLVPGAKNHLLRSAQGAFYHLRDGVPDYADKLKRQYSWL